jgi:hypothetical protein
MDKRFQVFVSSTFTDLIEERQNVMQALLELDCIPAGMELFSASDADQWSLIKEVIDDCDYYIVIIGGRYGSTTAEGISFTEKEFDYAVSIDKPILAFLHQDPDRIPAGKTEIDQPAREKLLAFREKAQTGRVCKYWTTPEDLGGKVSRSLIKTIKTHPAEGWIRGRYAATPEFLTEVNQLREAKRRLEASLAAMGTESPKGTEQYSGGLDTIEIHGTKEIGPDKTTEDWQLEVTWDDIFSYLGPIMYEDCNEQKMRDHLSRILKSVEVTDPQVEVHGFQLSNDSFQTIKIQLLALGLIVISEKHYITGIGNANWILTPFGQNYLLKLKAIKKEEFQRRVDDMRSKAIKRPATQE